MKYKNICKKVKEWKNNKYLTFTRYPFSFFIATISLSPFLARRWILIHRSCIKSLDLWIYNCYVLHGWRHSENACQNWYQCKSSPQLKLLQLSSNYPFHGFYSQIRQNCQDFNLILQVIADFRCPNTVSSDPRIAAIT